MNSRQKKFADNYIETGNAEQSALDAGYSKNYARAQSYKMLENVGIKKYIDKKMKELEDKKIAKAEEVLKYLTSLMRGEEVEEEIVLEMLGGGESKAKKVHKKVSHTDRIRAGELIGRRYGMWKDSPNKDIEQARAEQIKANTEFTKEKIKLLKGEEKDTSILDALIDLENENE